MKEKHKKIHNYYNNCSIMITDSKKGVSPILGMLFIILITMTTWSAIQSTQVPQWLKAVELEHSKSVETSLKKMIEYMEAGKDISIAIDGVKYPTIPFFMTPPPPYMVAYFEHRNFSADLVKFGEKQYPFTIGRNYTVLIIKIFYNFIEPETFVFDHGVLFKLVNGKLVNLTKKNELEFILINGSTDSLSVSQNVLIIKLKPASVNGFKTNVSGTIELESYNENTADYWFDSLNNIGCSATKIDSKDVKATLDNKSIRVIYYIDPVIEGIYKATNTSQEEPRFNHSISSVSQIVMQGIEYTQIKVQAVDQYFNPMPNFWLKATAEPEWCIFQFINGPVIQTDPEGIATVVFRINSSCSEFNVSFEALHQDKFY